MNPRAMALIGAAGIVLSSAGPAAQKTSISPKERLRFEAEIASIATPREKDVFRKLETDAGRGRFIEEFWLQRDPTPGTPANEFREEHSRRLAYADPAFGRGARGRGAETDRGRTYVILGLPLKVEKFERREIRPCEIWVYPANPLLGRREEFPLLFYEKGGGSFALYDPRRATPRALIRKASAFENAPAPPPGPIEGAPPSWIAEDKQAWRFLRDAVSPGLAAAIVSASPAFLDEIEKLPQKSIRDDYALDVLAGKPPTEVGYSVEAVGNVADVAVFRDPTGVDLVHFAVAPETFTAEAFEDRFFAAFRTTCRLEDSKGRTFFSEQRLVSIDLRKDEFEAVADCGFELYGAFPVIPGKHTLRILLENTVSKEFTTVERKITVPGAGEFGMSPMILARKAFQQAPSPGGPARAFQVGSSHLYPSTGRAFPEKERVQLCFQISDSPPAVFAAGRVEATLLKDGKPVETVRSPVRNFGEGGNILLELPTDRLLEGRYVLRVGIVEPDGREVLAAETTFEMTARTLRPSWVVAQILPPPYDPYYAYAQGIQYLGAGEVEKAFPFLDRAHANDAKNVLFGVGYARALLARKEPARARTALLRYVEPEGVDFALYETLGRASAEAGDLKDAVAWYERALTVNGYSAAVLNAVGDCHLALGNKEAAAAAWTRSLAVDPGQEEVKKKLSAVK